MVGLMGSGKSTVGRCVAAVSGRIYVDNDTTIERLAGRPTEELARAGGTVLHEWEAVYVRHAVGLGPVVAGVPASVADRSADLELLEGSGLVVYLRCRPEVLAARVARDAPRPWLSTAAVGVEPMLREMYDARDVALRRHAHLVLDAARSVPQLVGDVLAACAVGSSPGSGTG